MSKKIKDRFILVLQATIDLLGITLLIVSILKKQQTKKNKR